MCKRTLLRHLMERRLIDLAQSIVRANFLSISCCCIVLARTLSIGVLARVGLGLAVNCLGFVVGFTWRMTLADFTRRSFVGALAVVVVATEGVLGRVAVDVDGVWKLSRFRTSALEPASADLGALLAKLLRGVCISPNSGAGVLTAAAARLGVGNIVVDLGVASRFMSKFRFSTGIDDGVWAFPAFIKRPFNTQTIISKTYRTEKHPI